MAETELERAQKALRILDYDSLSEEEEEESENSRAIESFSAASTDFKTSSASASASTSTSVLAPPTIVPSHGQERGFFGADDRNPPAMSTASFDPYSPPSLNNGHNMNETATPAFPGIVSEFPPSVQQPRLAARIPAPNSLFDDDDSIAAVELPTLNSVPLTAFISNSTDNFSSGGAASISAAEMSNAAKATASSIPGAAGYLEMEEEPPRQAYYSSEPSAFTSRQMQPPDDEQIKTDSGLLLTHRRNPAAMKHRPQQHASRQPHPQPHHHDQPYPQHNQNHFPHVGRTFRNMQQEYFEVENGFLSGWKSAFDGSGRRQQGGNAGRHSMVAVQAKRLMSFVKIWVVLFALVLFAMTGVFWHSLGLKESTITKGDFERKSSAAVSGVNYANGGVALDDLLPDTTLDAPEEILLLPLEDISKLSSQHQLQLEPLQLGRFHGAAGTTSSHGHRFLRDLRDEFEAWMEEHGRAYHSEAEKEHRFSIWTQNHHRTIEKNRRHGPCRLTQQPVFGSNHLKDLAPEEFTSKFLTGYKGAFTDELEQKAQMLPPDVRRLRMESGQVLDPKIHKVNMHDSVKQRHLQYHPQTETVRTGSSSSPNCKWYDLSCFLRWIWKSTGIQFGAFITTMEPKYDSDSYPNSVDWRNSGAVTAVRTQGDCGACWAITAVETVESAHYLSTGNLYDLSESEIIVCEESCQMCSGGWPQNAYEWVMDQGGLPLLESYPYDATTLKYLTEAVEGTSNYYDESTVAAYRSNVCPADDRNSKSNGSGDSYWQDGKENENYKDYSDQGRYGNIKGYGYATDRCVCYTDGSGCECNVSL